MTNAEFKSFLRKIQMTQSVKGKGRYYVTIGEHKQFLRVFLFLVTILKQLLIDMKIKELLYIWPWRRESFQELKSCLILMLVIISTHNVRRFLFELAHSQRS